MLLKFLNSLLRKHPAPTVSDLANNPAGYDFTEDWFSKRIPIFEKHVAEPLAGTPCRLLEIGSFEGRASTWLVDHVLTNTLSRLDCVDFRLNEKLMRNIEKTGRADQVFFHQGLSQHVLRTLPLSSYDFIYVDGSHETIPVLEDAVAAFQLAKPGAIIAFDDYLWNDPAFNKHGVPKPALDAFLALYARPRGYQPMVDLINIGMDWQLWVRKTPEIIQI